MLIKFFVNDPAPPDTYPYLHTLSLHAAHPIWKTRHMARHAGDDAHVGVGHADILGRHITAAERFDHPAERLKPRLGLAARVLQHHRSEEHTSELQSLIRISYAVSC